MRFAPAAAVVIVLAAVNARATVLVPMDLNELAAAAHAVVYARITEVRPVVTDDRRRVESIVVAEAIGYMKGDLGRAIMFRIPGGQVGAYRTVMVGAPSFERGDEVILFFGARPPALPYIVGFSQGVYRVRIDERTGARVVVPPPAINTGDTVRLARGTRTPMALDAFAARVRALATAPARGAR
ncbi:MAG TPA: hypothetical protein VK886_06635 [Vicinamibacterales bacterium]|nr:hypothetical protein [Vicinamibacterales bacterium]